MKRLLKFLDSLPQIILQLTSLFELSRNQIFLFFCFFCLRSRISIQTLFVVKRGKLWFVQDMSPNTDSWIDLPFCKLYYISLDDGRVAIKSLHGRHLNGTDDKMDCYLLEIKPEALWTIHLAIHPQINLRNVNRRTYAHFVEDVNGKSIKVSVIPLLQLLDLHFPFYFLI